MVRVDLIVYPSLTLLIGGVLPFFLLRRLTKGRILGLSIILGGGVMLLSVVVQTPLQVLPRLILKGGVEQAAEVAILIYALGLTGFVQEGFKYIVARRGSVISALWVGFGFGIAEVIYVVLAQLVGLWIRGPIDVAYSLYPAYERLITLIFHVFSTASLAVYASRGEGLKGYLFMAVVHSGINLFSGLYLNYMGQESLMSLWGIPLYIALTPMCLIPYLVFRRSTAQLSEPQMEVGSARSI